MTLSVRRSLGGSGDAGPEQKKIQLALFRMSINENILQEKEGLTSNVDGM